MTERSQHSPLVLQSPIRDVIAFSLSHATVSSASLILAIVLLLSSSASTGAIFGAAAVLAFGVGGGMLRDIWQAHCRTEINASGIAVTGFGWSHYVGWDSLGPIDPVNDIETTLHGLRLTLLITGSQADAVSLQRGYLSVMLPTHSDAGSFVRHVEACRIKGDVLNGGHMVRLVYPRALRSRVQRWLISTASGIAAIAAGLTVVFMAHDYSASALIALALIACTLPISAFLIIQSVIGSGELSIEPGGFSITGLIRPLQVRWADVVAIRLRHDGLHVMGRGQDGSIQCLACIPDRYVDGLGYIATRLRAEHAQAITKA